MKETFYSEISLPNTQLSSLKADPHGSNFNDVINSLNSLRSLDKGLVLDLPQPTRVCAFTLCFLDDMPQQQENAGFKSQKE